MPPSLHWLVDPNVLNEKAKVSISEAAEPID
jgi:hypothetical protein